MYETVSYQNALTALAKAKVTRTESYIEIYLDIPSRMFPDVLRAKVSKRYDLSVVFITDNGTEQEWWTDGIVYNPFGGPARTVNNLQMQKAVYHDSEGNEANNNGPAVQEHDYGVHFIEEWLIKGSSNRSISHRVGGPSFTRLEYETPDKQTWLEFTISRNDINAITDVSPKFLKPGDPVTVFREREYSWYKHGKCYSDGNSFTHREDYGVAVNTRIEQRELDMYQRTFTVQRKFWWRNEEGQLHRVDGPAWVQLNHIEETQKISEGNVKKGVIKYGRTWKTQWTINNEVISTKYVLDWCRKNRVVLREGPCFDQSAFLKAEDELCFITDFLQLQP